VLYVFKFLESTSHLTLTLLSNPLKVMFTLVKMELIFAWDDNLVYVFLRVILKKVICACEVFNSD
jgi:hypothetical protein